AVDVADARLVAAPVGGDGVLDELPLAVGVLVDPLRADVLADVDVQVAVVVEVGGDDVVQPALAAGQHMLGPGDPLAVDVLEPGDARAAVTAPVGDHLDVQVTIAVQIAQVGERLVGERGAGGDGDVLPGLAVAVDVAVPKLAATDHVVLAVAVDVADGAALPLDLAAD